jgi:hypothetical protein
MPSTDPVDSRLTSNIEGYLFGTSTEVVLYNTLELQGFGHLYGYRYSARITQLRAIGYQAAIEWWIQLRSGRRITIAETQPWNQAETLEGLIAADLIIGYGSKFGASIREPLPEGRYLDLIGVAEEQGWPGFSGQDSPSSWGAIYGDISDQGDLMGALNAKASRVYVDERFDELADRVTPAQLQQLSDDLAALRAIAATDEDLAAEVADLQATIDALLASGATDSELAAEIGPIQAAIALLASEDGETAAAIAAVQASISSLDATYATDAQLSAAISGLGATYATIQGVNAAIAAALRRSEPFASPLVIRFQSLTTDYGSQQLSAPLAIELDLQGANNSSSATIRLTASGNASHIPTFASQFSQLSGSAGWSNTSGAVNLISFFHLSGSAYYSISQPIPVVPSTPPVNPSAETFIDLVRRSPGITLAGVTYTAAAESSIWTTLAQSDLKMAGNGYVRVAAGTPTTPRQVWGLSTALGVNNYVGWKYAVVRNTNRNYVDAYHQGSLVNSFFLPVDADMRMIRTGDQVAIQSKTESASTWTNHYSFAQTFTGNLWFSASFDTATSGGNASLVNPRMFGAS